jgi:hypothetical protein
MSLAVNLARKELKMTATSVKVQADKRKEETRNEALQLNKGPTQSKSFVSSFLLLFLVVRLLDDLP